MRSSMLKHEKLNEIKNVVGFVSYTLYIVTLYSYTLYIVTLYSYTLYIVTLYSYTLYIAEIALRTDRKSVV